MWWLSIYYIVRSTGGRLDDGRLGFAIRVLLLGFIGRFVIGSSVFSAVQCTVQICLICLCRIAELDISLLIGGNKWIQKNSFTLFVYKLLYFLIYDIKHDSRNKNWWKYMEAKKIAYSLFINYCIFLIMIYKLFMI